MSLNVQFDYYYAAVMFAELVKAKPVRVKLHVSLGRIADGTIGLVAVDGAPAHLVVQAQG